MEKSYVSLEAKVCPVCGKQFETDSILLDRRVQPVFERETVTGWGLCPEHAKQQEDGYTFLVEIDPDKSSTNNGTIKPEDAYRTGVFVAVKANVLDILGFPEEIRDKRIIFIDHEMVEILTNLNKESIPNE